MARSVSGPQGGEGHRAAGLPIYLDTLQYAHQFLKSGLPVSSSSGLYGEKSSAQTSANFQFLKKVVFDCCAKLHFEFGTALLWICNALLSRVPNSVWSSAQKNRSSAQQMEKFTISWVGDKSLNTRRTNPSIYIYYIIINIYIPCCAELQHKKAVYIYNYVREFFFHSKKNISILHLCICFLFLAEFDSKLMST